MKNALVMILAGGEGKRLFPLTKDRAKPAVPFGGKYRIIDFVINNFINSGFYKIKILTQFKSDSLNRHITRTWPKAPFPGHYLDLVPAQMRRGSDWYMGTADAIYQNINLIEDDNPDYVCVFGGDHIYKMDISQMTAYHVMNKAELTIAAIPVPVQRAREYGVLAVDESYKIIGWDEKPENPREIPGQPGWALASLGNYVFNKGVLIEELHKDAANKNSKHDFGHSIIPQMLAENRVVYAYDFHSNTYPGLTDKERGYWRDVGDIDSYWEAHMDLVDVSPVFNLYNRGWPIRTFSYQAPPSKYVFDQDDRRGTATDSIVADGCIISGGRLHRCVFSPYVRINSFSVVVESILMHGVNVGRHAQLNRTLIDKGVEIPAHARIGFNREEDIAKGYYVSPGGVTVVAKGTIIQ